MKRKTTKINPKPTQAKEKEEPLDLPFHLTFPVHLSYKDGKEKKECYFKDTIDMKKYVKRYGLKPKNYTVTDTEPR